MAFYSRKFNANYSKKMRRCFIRVFGLVGANGEIKFLVFQNVFLVFQKLFYN